ncbi:MAG: hypothetical protein KC733_12515, partial [Candidatus Omnitrophica bacterium]|nr:hypothetical protein [Candidatus Omnitrophota bacterium]
SKNMLNLKKIIYYKKAQSTLEYITFIVFILGALLVFQKYIARSLVGRWKTAGDGLGSERIYDPQKSIECAFDFVQHDPGIWYDTACYKAACVDLCLTNIPDIKEVYPPCRDCINSCRTSFCEGNERSE